MPADNAQRAGRVHQAIARIRLTELDHAVVFFDECDELFRDRSTADEAARNILSFATASMLPKLQRLHDARKVLFVLGTNFVRNIDPAIRRPGRFDDILLFDRPDHSARLAIAKKTYAQALQKRVEDLSAREVSKLGAIADASAGWMIEQIISRVTSYVDRRDFPSPSLSDYADWCNHDGVKELDAAGVDKVTQSKIQARWAPFMR